MDQALAVPWHGSDRLAIAQALVAEPAASPLRARRKQQDYTSLHGFFAEGERLVLRDDSVAMVSKVQLLISRAGKLGCRCPTEPSLKMWASLAIATGGDHASMTPAQKGEMHRFLRTEFKRAVRYLPDPPAYLEKLPTVPQDLQRLCPQLYREAYESTGPPVACMVDSTLLISVNSSFRCRGADRAAQPTNAPAPLTVASPGGDALSQIASMMLSMQHQNQQLLQAVFAPQTGRLRAMGNFGGGLALPAPGSH